MISLLVQHIRQQVGFKSSLLILGVLLAVIAFTLLAPIELWDVPQAIILPINDWVGSGLNWVVRDVSIGGITLQETTRTFSVVFEAPIKVITILLSDGISSGSGFNKKEWFPPLSWVGVISAASWLAWKLSGRNLAILIIIAGLYLVTFGLWASAMTTLASVLICVVLALVLGLFLGIRSYRSPRTEVFTRGMMNVMQTVPIFSYLIPTLLLFGYGPSAALFATVIYALPPMVHATVLALRSIPDETLELARITGCTRRQTLWRVELPVAVPRLAIGLNQVVMMSLNMVIIASMIGAGGLGDDVLRALRRLDIGSGLQAGIGFVVLAVILDRLTQAAAAEKSRGHHKIFLRHDYVIVITFILVSTALSFIFPTLAHWPKDWVLTTATYWNDLVSWINVNFFDALEAFRTSMLLYVMYPVRDALLGLPYTGLIAVVSLLGYYLGGFKLAATVFGLLSFIGVSGYWDEAMVSVYLIIISVILVLLVGIPIGIWLAKRPRWHELATFILDTLQTLPTLVYLLPAVMLFRNGDFSALIAVIMYAIAPAVRYTMQGMRSVPHDRLEAAMISGATPWQTLKWVRLPAAAPTLVLGINQTVMMALSMLIIAALVGTRELGQEVFTALSRGNTGAGIIAGLCVAAIALTFDGLLKAWSKRLEQ